MSNCALIWIISTTLTNITGKLELGTSNTENENAVISWGQKNCALGKWETYIQPSKTIDAQLSSDGELYWKSPNGLISSAIPACLLCSTSERPVPRRTISRPASFTASSLWPLFAKARVRATPPKHHRRTVISRHTTGGCTPNNSPGENNWTTKQTQQPKLQSAHPLGIAQWKEWLRALPARCPFSPGRTRWPQHQPWIPAVTRDGVLTGTSPRLLNQVSGAQDPMGPRLGMIWSLPTGCKVVPLTWTILRSTTPAGGTEGTRHTLFNGSTGTFRGPYLSKMALKRCSQLSCNA